MTDLSIREVEDMVADHFTGWAYMRGGGIRRAADVLLEGKAVRVARVRNALRDGLRASEEWDRHMVGPTLAEQDVLASIEPAPWWDVPGFVFVNERRRV